MVLDYKILLILIFFAFSCNESKPESGIKSQASGKQESDARLLTPESYLHAAESKLTELIVKDIFTPPVASRVYVYPMLAAYEAGRWAKSGELRIESGENVQHSQSSTLNPQPYPSLTTKMKGFTAMPLPEKGKNYNFSIAAIKALCSTAKKVVFSSKDVDEFEAETLKAMSQQSNTSEEVYKNSVAFGDSVANIFIKRLNTDNYKETRGMERFEVKDLVGRWVPTPPDYADGVEPNWSKMKTLVADAPDQIRAEKAAPYSEDKNSAFWKEVVEVHQISKTLDSTQENIVAFWDDNPFVSRHKGHLMLQDKKMTPGGHWMAICQLALKEKKADFTTSLQAYAVTSTVLYEAFISCWAEKYKSLRLRPETIISAKIEKQWHPFLVTPPFPAYTSGHSTISAAAAEVLTKLFGDNYAYTDITEKEYGLPVRSFTSFRQAAKEASVSRLYAGIHYRSDCDKGNEQGVKVGNFVSEKLK